MPVDSLYQAHSLMDSFSPSAGIERVMIDKIAR